MEDQTTYEQSYFQMLEKGLSTLPQEEIGKVFRPCAINCVKDNVMAEQRRKFDACHGDINEFYGSKNDTEYFFSKIIEKGHIYEIGYPRCFCPMVSSGFATSPVHCECSRQSILYVLNELMPEKKIQVEMIESVLTGGEKCRFRVIMQ